MARQKFTISDAECLNQGNTSRGSNASLIVKSAEQPKALPGQPQAINARKTIQFNFDDTTGKNFEPGKKYKITVEEM